MGRGNGLQASPINLAAQTGRAVPLHTNVVAQSLKLARFPGSDTVICSGSSS